MFINRLVAKKRPLKASNPEYELLLADLNESREHLRVLQVTGDQQNVDVAKAYYRLDSAAAAIRALLVSTGAS